MQSDKKLPYLSVLSSQVVLELYLLLFIAGSLVFSLLLYYLLSSIVASYSCVVMVLGQKLTLRPMKMQVGLLNK